jgi:tetratricopeptide (TPR) repeat protein
LSDSKEPGVQTERTELPDIRERAHAVVESMEAGGEGTPKRFWSIKNWATWVSVVAAVVSVAVAAYSTAHGWAQERHAKRIELTAMIEKLVTLQDNPNDQYAVLGKLAPRLLDELSSDVSGPEYSIVARALLASGNTKLAITYAQEAVRKAENTNDKTWAWRQLGWILIQSGANDAGDETYSKALNVFRQENIDEQQVSVKTDKAYTYVDWAQVAALSSRCEKSRELRKEAQGLMPSVVFQVDEKVLTSRLNELDGYLNVCSEKKSGKK